VTFFIIPDFLLGLFLKRSCHPSELNRNMVRQRETLRTQTVNSECELFPSPNQHAYQKYFSLLTPSPPLALIGSNVPEVTEEQESRLPANMSTPPAMTWLPGERAVSWLSESAPVPQREPAAPTGHDCCEIDAPQRGERSGKDGKTSRLVPANGNHS